MWIKIIINICMRELILFIMILSSDRGTYNFDLSSERYRQSKIDYDALPEKINRYERIFHHDTESSMGETPCDYV